MPVGRMCSRRYPSSNVSSKSGRPKERLELRKRIPHYVKLAGLFGSIILVGADAGTWKLNLAKSSFNPGPPFKSFTLTFTPDGVRHLNLVAAGGEPRKISLPW